MENYNYKKMSGWLYVYSQMEIQKNSYFINIFTEKTEHEIIFIFDA